MYKNLTKISTLSMERDEWLEHRRRSIGKLMRNAEDY